MEALRSRRTLGTAESTALFAVDEAVVFATGGSSSAFTLLGLAFVAGAVISLELANSLKLPELDAATDAKEAAESGTVELAGLKPAAASETKITAEVKAAAIKNTGPATPGANSTSEVK